MTITINKTDYEFKFNFSRLKKLVKLLGIEASELSEVKMTLENITIIASIGMDKTVEEIDAILDKADFSAVGIIAGAFSSEVINYIDPNLQSQTN